MPIRIWAHDHPRFRTQSGLQSARMALFHSILHRTPFLCHRLGPAAEWDLPLPPDRHERFRDGQRGGPDLQSDFSSRNHGSPRSRGPKSDLGNDRSTARSAQISDQLLLRMGAYGRIRKSGSGEAESQPSAGAGDQPVPVAATLSGLGPGTTYHYRLVARSDAGIVASGDYELETLNACLRGCPKAGASSWSLRKPAHRHTGHAPAEETGFQAGRQPGSLAYRLRGFSGGDPWCQVLYQASRGSGASGWTSSQSAPRSLPVTKWTELSKFQQQFLDDARHLAGPWLRGD